MEVIFIGLLPTSTTLDRTSTVGGAVAVEEG